MATRRVCFSFSAYAKNLIERLKSIGVSVDTGLSDHEFAAVESAFNFTFPPGLRSILREGLPVGPGFPNWRSSSTQQLHILTHLPFLGIIKEVRRNNFWVPNWGKKPVDSDEAEDLANGFLKRVPFLVPIYRNCYIPSSPNLAGNPVFQVDGGDVKVVGFDVAGFFQVAEFGSREGVPVKPSLESLMGAPAWAATEAREVEFWTDLAEGGVRREAEDGGVRWWWVKGDLGGCMEDVCWTLRGGGWREDEVREMTMMDDGDEGGGAVALQRRKVAYRAGPALVRHVRALSVRLLRAGWSTEDVADSLGCHFESGGGGGDEVDSWLDFQQVKNTNSLEAI